MTALLALVFFLSGAAGLVFETLWFRQAGLAFGNSFWASSLVLSSFMAGLALGNGLVARFGARVRDPLRTYALLEIVIGVSGVLLVVTLPHLTPLLATVLRPFLDQPWLANPLRLATGFCLLALPATAMGATLPLLVRVLSARDANFGAALGRLYGWNTLGAFVGCLAGEIALVERLGVRGTSLVAAGANFVAAAGGYWLARRASAAGGLALGAPKPARALTRFAWRCLLAAALSGALLLALEVVWFRFLHLFVHAGAVAFAVVLATVLVGIALGGLAGGAWSRRDAEAHRHVPALALLSGVLVVGCYAGFRFALSEDGGYAREFGRIAWLGAALMLPGSLVSGALFTLIGAAAQRELGNETRAAGLVTLANTAGAALGSLLAGFALLPELGIERSLALLAALYAGVALLAWPAAAAGAQRAAFVLAALWLAALVMFPFGSLRDVHLVRAVASYGTPEEVVAVREGRTETAVLLRPRFLGEPLEDTLVTDAYSMAGTTLRARRYMQLFVQLPVALRPEPRQALLISYGVGTTASAMTRTRSLEHIDVVDTSRDILELSDLIYPDAERHPLRDPRVEVHVEDGRYFLETTQRRYDLITGEPPPPKAAGIESLYTREYFALVHARLAERGIATYWLPLHSLASSDALAITRGFCDVFEDCSLWMASGSEWMLAGSRGGVAAPREQAFAAQWRDPLVGPELREIGIERPELLGTTFLADAEQLAELTRGVRPLVDDFPKRLTDGLFTDTGAAVPLLRWGLDAEAARQRFRESRFIGRVWPAPLLEQTLGSFWLQDIATKFILGQWVPLANVAALHRVLTTTELETLPLWMLGSDADRLRIAERVVARDPDSALAQRHVGFGALARRDYAGAVRALDASRRADPADATSLHWQLYALCALERCDEAATLLRGAEEQALEQLDAPRFRRGLQLLFGFDATGAR